MNQVASRTHKTTLYRLDGVDPTAEGLPKSLDERYLGSHDFFIEKRRIGDVPALLVYGSVPCGRADWCDVITNLTGEDLGIGYSSAGAALVLAVDGEVYALTYGTLGRHLIDLKLADAGFGIAFAVRALDSRQINGVKRRVFGLAARIDRNFVPGGQHIRQYGIDKWGELVGQVRGKMWNARITACRSGKRAIWIEGGDSLQIELGTDPDDLVSDLREIQRVSRKDAPSVDLEFMTQIRPVVANERLDALNARLDALLGEKQPTGLSTAVPMSCVEEIERVQRYEIYIPRSGYKRSESETEVTLQSILRRTNAVAAGYRLASLQNGRISLFIDRTSQDPVASSGAHKWINAQLSEQAVQLLYLEGKWYEIGEKHLEFLRDEIKAILGRPSSLTLPPWTANLPDEDAYNRYAAETDSELILLDKHYLKTEQHARGRGIEACDLLGPGLELIHVKKAGRSSSLSHLFFQGEVAVDALKHESDARQKLFDLVHQQRPDHPLPLDFQPRKMVYAIAPGPGKRLDVNFLFTFAQVALYRTVRALRNEDVDVEVIEIPS